MIINLNKLNLKVKHYSLTEEVGGLIIGKWIDINSKTKLNKWKLRKLLSFRNTAQNKTINYILPNGLILTIKTIPYILLGYYVVGCWHTHPTGKLKPSRQDEIQASIFFHNNRFLKINRFILGIGAEAINLEGKKYFKLNTYIYKRKN